MTNADEFDRFNGLTFDDFRRLAQDSSLSCHEKVGFPNSYREGKEKIIFSDILDKLQGLGQKNRLVMEIGPGCSELPVMLASHCEENGGHLILVDSAEMLALLPEGSHISKVAGAFPAAMESSFAKYFGKVDSIIAYSVIQYVFQEGNLWGFVDRCLELLADGGEMLLGDIPNVSMRKRFLTGRAGLAFHRRFAGDDSKPNVVFNQLELGKIDDSVVLAILGRVRAQGCHAWVLPQKPGLPMANRREDILVRKP